MKLYGGSAESASGSNKWSITIAKGREWHARRGPTEHFRAVQSIDPASILSANVSAYREGDERKFSERAPPYNSGLFSSPPLAYRLCLLHPLLLLLLPLPRLSPTQRAIWPVRATSLGRASLTFSLRASG